MIIAPGAKTMRIVTLALVSLVVGVMPVVSAGAGARTVTRNVARNVAHLILPPHEPTFNFRLANVTRVLAAIDAARKAEEGLAPLSFDAARFARLSVPEQVFVLSNLERTTRGLYPAVAMVKRLDVIAVDAARRDQDPVDHGQGFASIWSSPPASLGQTAFFADFGWMYDDGPPPQHIFRNVECLTTGQSGCWGHRENILSNPLHGWRGCRGELVTGAGFVLGTPDGPSLTQIFEVACANQASAPAFTWRFAVAYLRIPADQAGLG